MEFKIFIQDIQFCKTIMFLNILLVENLNVHYECQALIFPVLTTGSIVSVCQSPFIFIMLLKLWFTL